MSAIPPTAAEKRTSILVCFVPLADIERLLDQAVGDSVGIAATTPINAAALSEVSATSCKARLWEKEPSKDDAISQLREQTRSRGGNAVGNLICEPVNSSSCIAAIECRGIALKR